MPWCAGSTDNGLSTSTSTSARRASTHASAELDVPRDGATDLGDQAELGPPGGVQGTHQLDDAWALPRSRTPRRPRGVRASRSVGWAGRTATSLDFKFT